MGIKLISREKLETLVNLDANPESIDANNENYESYKKLKDDLVKVSPKAKKLMKKMAKLLNMQEGMDALYANDMDFLAPSGFWGLTLAAAGVAIATLVLGAIPFAIGAGIACLAFAPAAVKSTVDLVLNRKHIDYWHDKANKLAPELVKELENNKDKLAEHTAILEEILEAYHGIEIESENTQETENTVEENSYTDSKESTVEIVMPKPLNKTADKEIDERK